MCFLNVKFGQMLASNTFVQNPAEYVNFRSMDVFICNLIIILTFCNVQTIACV